MTQPNCRRQTRKSSLRSLPYELQGAEFKILTDTEQGGSGCKLENQGVEEVLHRVGDRGIQESAYNIDTGKDKIGKAQ